MRTYLPRAAGSPLLQRFALPHLADLVAGPSVQTGGAGPAVLAPPAGGAVPTAPALFPGLGRGTRQGTALAQGAEHLAALGGVQAARRSARRGKGRRDLLHGSTLRPRKGTDGTSGAALHLLLLLPGSPLGPTAGDPSEPRRAAPPRAGRILHAEAPRGRPSRSCAAPRRAAPRRSVRASAPQRDPARLRRQHPRRGQPKRRAAGRGRAARVPVGRLRAPARVLPRGEALGEGGAARVGRPWAGVGRGRGSGGGARDTKRGGRSRRGGPCPARARPPTRAEEAPGTERSAALHTARAGSSRSAPGGLGAAPEGSGHQAPRAADPGRGRPGERERRTGLPRASLRPRLCSGGPAPRPASSSLRRGWAGLSRAKARPLPVPLACSPLPRRAGDAPPRRGWRSARAPAGPGAM